MTNEFIEDVTLADAAALLADGFTAHVYRAASGSYEVVGAEEAIKSISNAIRVETSRCIRVLFIDTGDRLAV